MGTTQMNVRLDAGEKAAGDAAWESIGYTPSRIVQETWSFAARNRYNKHALRKFAKHLGESGNQLSSEQEDRLKWHALAPGIYETMLAEMGIEGIPEPLGITDGELLYEAYLDKMAEKGMPA